MQIFENALLQLKSQLQYFKKLGSLHKESLIHFFIGRNKVYKENIFFLKGRWSDPRWVTWAPVTKWPGQLIEDLQLNYDLKTTSSLTQGEMAITISSILSSLALNQHLEKLPGIPGKSFPGIIINVKMFINHGLILWSSSCLQAAVWDPAFSLAWTEQGVHIGPAEIVQELVQELV